MGVRQRLTVFERATDRLLRALFLLVATAFASHADALRRGAEDQSDVLAAIADLVGMDVDRLREPLEDPEREARVQREAFQTASSWAVLSLLWTLAENRPAVWTPDEWEANTGAGEMRPAGGSSLATHDEKLALELAAKTLAASDALSEGRSMLLRGTPVFVLAGEAGTSARPVDPAFLVDKRGEPDAAPPALAVGDEVWFDADKREPTVRGGYRCERPGRITMTETGELAVDDGLRLTVVADGIWSYCSGI